MTSIQEYEPLFFELESALKSESWFTSVWRTKAGLHPSSVSPKSVAIQVFKDSWFNEDGKGIHFESWMTNADVKRGTASIVLHIESSKQRTGINGKTLAKSLLESSAEQIVAWDGFQIKENYTMQPFSKRAQVTPGSFIEIMTTEFSRLASISEQVDQAISTARIQP